MDSMKVQKLQKWKPQFKRGKNFSMLILASRGSGKSYLCRYLLEYHLRDKYDSFLVISDSEDELENYREILPGNLFFTDFNPAIIKKAMEINSRSGKKVQMLVLFDDKISNKMKFNDEILQLFTRGRHVGISVIFISQSHAFASAAWRNNSDKIIVLRQNAKQARDAINENILIGSVDVPEEYNEKKYYMKLMREYINKEGDALVLDFDEGAFNNLRQYRAPEVKKQPIRIEDKKEVIAKPTQAEIINVEEEIIKSDSLTPEEAAEIEIQEESYSSLEDSDDDTDTLDFGFNFG